MLMVREGEVGSSSQTDSILFNMGEDFTKGCMPGRRMMGEEKKVTFDPTVSFHCKICNDPLG